MPVATLVNDAMEPCICHIITNEIRTLKYTDLILFK